MLPSDLTTTSLGLLSRFPSYRSASVTTLPSPSVRDKRRSCSQASRRPSLSRVSPFDRPLGARKTSADTDPGVHRYIVLAGMSENSR